MKITVNMELSDATAMNFLYLVSHNTDMDYIIGKAIEAAAKEENKKEFERNVSEKLAHMTENSCCMSNIDNPTSMILDELKRQVQLDNAMSEIERRKPCCMSSCELMEKYNRGTCCCSRPFLYAGEHEYERGHSGAM